MTAPTADRQPASAPKGKSAVMAQKKPGKLSSGQPWENLELYPTPPWATRALFEHVLPRVGGRPKFAWDPCAGLGHMLEVLHEYCDRAHGSDIHIYDMAPIDAATRLKSSAFGIVQADFFDAETVWPLEWNGWIVTNPAFTRAGALLEKAMDMPQVDGVAMLQRLQWIATEGRYEDIWKKAPPFVVAFFAERVSMCLGGWDMKGSFATDYAWFIWRRELHGAREWAQPVLSDFYGLMIPPCKVALTRPGDRELARRCVPGFVPPTLAKKVSPDQGGLI